jgi:AmiR/NasT family two-component response regulator
VTSTASIQDGLTRSFLERLAALRAENNQLRTALQTRIIIEQAKGAISVRCGVTPDRAFHMMRARARSRRQSIHAYAAEIVANGGRFAAEREVS